MDVAALDTSPVVTETPPVTPVTPVNDQRFTIQIHHVRSGAKWFITDFTADNAKAFINTWYDSPDSSKVISNTIDETTLVFPYPVRIETVINVWPATVAIPATPQAAGG